MTTSTTITCDACGGAIDPSGTYLSILSEDVPDGHVLVIVEERP